MTESVECPLDRNLPPQGHPWRRWAVGTTYFLAFVILATVSLTWALGYRVNWTAGTLEQTGLLELSTSQVGLNPDVYLNGVKQATSLPISFRWLFAGQYDVEIKKDGYQTWQKQISVSTNERVNYPSIFLLYVTPKESPVPDIRIDEIEGRTYDNGGIEVRSGNELWVNNIFITRTSEDILNPEYYQDESHVVYQVGDRLVLRDLTSNISEDVITFNQKTSVPYVFQDNGRVLAYLDDTTLKAVALYEPISFIDRFNNR